MQKKQGVSDQRPHQFFLVETVMGLAFTAVSLANGQADLAVLKA